jgi:hypothetical protein
MILEIQDIKKKAILLEADLIPKVGFIGLKTQGSDSVLQSLIEIVKINCRLRFVCY